MAKPAADEFETIRRNMEYERGFAACMKGATRAVPDGCLDSYGWLQGFDEAAAKKPKGD